MLLLLLLLHARRRGVAARVGDVLRGVARMLMALAARAAGRAGALAVVLLLDKEGVHLHGADVIKGGTVGAAAGEAGETDFRVGVCGWEKRGLGLGVARALLLLGCRTEAGDHEAVVCCCVRVRLRVCLLSASHSTRVRGETAKAAGRVDGRGFGARVASFAGLRG